MEDDPFSDDPFGDPPQRPTFSANKSTDHSPATVVPRTRWGVKTQIVLIGFVVLTSCFLGVCVYQTVTGIALSAEGMAQLSLWSWVFLPSAVLCFIVSILCLVALARTQATRLLIGIGTLSSFVLPGIAAYIAARLGVDRVTAYFGHDLSKTLADANLTPLLEWLLSFLGGR